MVALFKDSKQILYFPAGLIHYHFQTPLIN
jgi:hypothetical protein